MSLRPAVAWVIPGGVGTGKDHIGVPVLNELLHRIAKDFELVVFSLAKINPGFEAKGFTLVEVPYRNPVLGAFHLFRAVRREHKRYAFVAIHGFWGLPTGLLAVVAGKWLGIRSIVSVLGGDAAGIPAIQYGRLHKPFHRRLLFWGLHHANSINALTYYLVKNLEQAGFHRSIDVLPWGVDASTFRYRAKPLGTPIQFLHVANFHPVKDQATMLRAFAHISCKIDSQLTIVGSGVDEARVRALIHELGLDNLVQILAPMPYSKLPEVYHRSDVLLHTSLSEGQCEVVTEAMSCGVVVCGTQVGLMYDLAHACVTAAVGDDRTLAEKVLELLSDPVKFETLRKAAHEWTRAHDLTWTAAKLHSLYQESVR